MELKQVKHCTGIDLSTWGFPIERVIERAIEPIIAEIVTETVREQFAETPPSLSWPTIWRDRDRDA
jgi:hypothetical protein